MVTALRRRLRWTIGPVLTGTDLAAVLVAVLAQRVALLPALVAAGVAVLVARAADLHRPRLVLSIVEDLAGLVVAAAAATAVLVAADASGALFGVLALACLVLGRTTVYAGTHVLRRSGRLRRRVVVVGTGATARRLATTLASRPELGLLPVGFVGSGPASPRDQARGLPLALLGPATGLARAMSESHVDAALVAFAGPPGEQETAVVAGLLATPAEVYAVPTWLPPTRSRARHPREVVAGVTVVHLHRRAAWAPLRAFRRLVEVLVALVALAVLLPVFGLLAVLVKLETGGVLVQRQRLDDRGVSVAVPRFRTRRARSVARPGTTFSVAISGRLGPVGRFLRRTRLVALPGLLRGLVLRVRYAGGVPGGAPSPEVSAPPARTDQAQVDASQLAR